MWKSSLCLIILQIWLLEQANGKVDICTALCRCVNESRFVKIHCDLIDNKVSHGLLHTHRNYYQRNFYVSRKGTRNPKPANSPERRKYRLSQIAHPPTHNLSTCLESCYIFSCEHEKRKTYSCLLIDILGYNQMQLNEIVVCSVDEKAKLNHRV